MSKPRVDIVKPFKVAMNGIVFTFKTQRHMRFHVYAVLLLLLLGVFVNLGLREMLVMLFTISLVLVAEMFNSAIEAVVDLVSPNYHPLAKFAKDIAAGAVLISTSMALVVGSLMMIGEDRWETLKISLTSEGFGFLGVLPRLVIGSLVLFIMVIIGKGLGQRGTVLQGGLVSGHAAFGFFFATSIIFLTDNALAAGIGILLAAIICQSRFEAKFHTIFELSLGATIGVVLSIAIFGLVPR
jgi:diacylglycerol kinase (ATP)